MKKILKSINWSKFFKLELFIFSILSILYLILLLNGRNIWPEHVWSVPLITLLISILVLIVTISDYLVLLFKEKKRKNYCENCMYNNEKLANHLFYKNYCTLCDCPMTGDDKCKHFKNKK